MSLPPLDPAHKTDPASGNLAGDAPVIDPVLTLSSYLGGSEDDDGHSVVIDAQGRVIVAGWTTSTDFPTTPDAIQPTSTGGTCFSPPPFNIPFPCSDGFVSIFSPDGSTLLYSTYLGGTQDDGLRAVAVDEGGNIYLTGWTTSLDFPTANPIQPANGGGANRTPDAFIAKLSADGSTLLYSTYLGGAARDYGDNLAVDADGAAYVTGWTESADFPAVNAIQPFYGGGFFDGFVAKVNPAGDAFVYTTYLGGSDLDYTFGVDADGSGHAYLTGFTLSADFPTANAFQPVFGGGVEAYVTKLAPDGGAYVFSTYFGSDDTRGYDLRVGDDEAVYLVGGTSSAAFPVVNPLQANYSGFPMDAFLTRFLPDGSGIDFSTYLGGNGNDIFHTLALDSAANVLFTGWTTSTDFPLSNPLQGTHAGSNDVIFGRISAALDALDFSTYLGGSSYEMGYAAAAGSDGIAVVGTTASLDFPLAAPFQPLLFGDSDGFVAIVQIDSSEFNLFLPAAWRAAE